MKSEGLWDNTVIIYTSDQGMMLGEHDLQDKRWMYEESMRMPFIVHYPRMIKPGIVTVTSPLTTARQVAERILTLPIYYDLELDQVEQICETLQFLHLST